MKKIILIAVLVLGAFFILSPRVLFVRNAPPPGSEIKATPAVSVILDTGSTVATISGVTAQNAYQALVEAAKKQNLELKTKQYDFGVFVEQIGTLPNTKEKSWIYFVNGKAGTIAADKQPVANQDTVEWKYMVPTTE